MAGTTAIETKSVFIAGPFRDWFFLIAAPVVALGVFVLFELNPVVEHEYGGETFGGSLRGGFLTTVIFAHIVLVFFRSHLNADIFRLYPMRFIVVPIVMFVTLSLSLWALVVMLLIGVWWDVYHSGMQTFGIGRIYDMKAGNRPDIGRRLDIVMNTLVYLGPILAGATLINHLELGFEGFENVGAALLTEVPAESTRWSRYATYSILAFGIPFSAYYLYRYWQLARQGYRVPVQKIALYVILVPVSIFCWGFNSFGEAFFVMNFFHAVQYFFLVWHLEGKNLTRRFGLSKLRYSRFLTLVLFVFLTTTFGIWASAYWTDSMPSGHVFLAILTTLSILHFWYDGFIWSVRKGQVR